MNFNLKEFLNFRNLNDINIRILRIEKEKDVFISIDNIEEIDQKNEICLDIEIFFKKIWKKACVFIWKL